VEGLGETDCEEFKGPGVEGGCEEVGVHVAGLLKSPHSDEIGCNRE